MGYCVETDLARVGGNNTTTPQGSYSAELDCDNDRAPRRLVDIEQAISECRRVRTAIFLQGRIDYPDYDRSISAARQLATYPGLPIPTSATAVYRTMPKTIRSTFFSIPTTQFGADASDQRRSMSLAGSNLIDSCVYSNNWIQRSVRIDITTAGYYWLSFAATATNNSFGGQLDQIQLCVATCRAAAR